MYFPQLQELSDTSSIYVHIQQHAFADTLAELGQYDWNVDLVQGMMTFTSREATGGQQLSVGYRTELIASIAPGPRSLLWAWARDHTGQVEPRFAMAMRDYGQQAGVPMLTQPEVPFEVPEGTDDEEWCRQAAHDIGRAYTTITGNTPYLATGPGNGSQMVFSIEGIQLPTPRLDVTTPRVIMEAIETADVRDHRRAIHGLATKSGWELQWAPDLTSLILRDPVNGNSASLSFDHLGRNDRMNLTLHGQGGQA